MKIHYFFWVLFLGPRLNAQICVGSLHAYSKKQAVGNPPVGVENRLPNEFLYSVYIEGKANVQPVVSDAWINGHFYHATISNTGTQTLQPGIINSNRPVKIKAAKGKVWWLAEMERSAIKKTIPSSFKHLKNGIVLIGIDCGKKKYYKAIPLTELSSIDTVFNY